MMEVVVTPGAVGRVKRQPSHHHQQTNAKLFTGRMSFYVAQPTLSEYRKETAQDRNGQRKLVYDLYSTGSDKS